MHLIASQSFLLTPTTTRVYFLIACIFNYLVSKNQCLMSVENLLYHWFFHMACWITSLGHWLSGTGYRLMVYHIAWLTLLTFVYFLQVVVNANEGPENTALLQVIPPHLLDRAGVRSVSTSNSRSSSPQPSPMFMRQLEHPPSPQSTAGVEANNGHHKIWRYYIDHFITFLNAYLTHHLSHLLRWRVLMFADPQIFEGIYLKFMDISLAYKSVP